MAFKDWFSRRSPLQLALERGTRPGSNLADELRGLRDYSIKSKADAEAICGVLEQFASTASPVSHESGFYSIVGLFQDVEGSNCPAFDVMSNVGISLLAQIVNDALQNPSRLDDGDLLFALKILAMYGTPEGTSSVLRAARLPLKPDDWMWSMILKAYSKEHPGREWLFKELSESLPSDFLAVSLLDSANAAHLEGVDTPHPFDSVAGKRQLEHWLTDSDEDHFSYAVSAAASLPYIRGTERDSLLAIAFDHPSADVQLEAAWVAAKLKRDAGIKWLARSCLDVNLAERASQYLTELNREDAIPTEAQNAGFKARAEFAQWLAHPSELGRPPEEVLIVDHRELNWPPEREPKPMWLLKYRLQDTTGLKADDIGVGLVGSVTFCLFSYELQQRSPEDCYAIYCYWEMSNRDLIAETDVPENSTEYNRMLQQCKLDGLDQVRIVFVAELSRELRYPQNMVALGKSTRNGQPGWIVLDGPRSCWYAKSEMPAVSTDKTVAMIHIGRELLGLHDHPDRQKFLQSAPRQRSPAQIIAAYEKLLDKARNDPRQAEKLLGNHSILGTAFSDYVAALSATTSQSHTVSTCTAYEALLTLASKMDSSLQAKLLDSFSPLGETFDAYVDALIELNRQSEVPALVEKFRPHWDHNLGYGKLGSSAFKSGHEKIAESFIVTLRNSLKDWCRCEEMGYLAEIWKKQGRTEDAHTLMIDALTGLLAQSREATGSDCQLFDNWFQLQRSTYLKLFPERGENELRLHGIPASTLA